MNVTPLLPAAGTRAGPRQAHGFHDLPSNLACQIVPSAPAANTNVACSTRRAVGADAAVGSANKPPPSRPQSGNPGRVVNHEIETSDEDIESARCGRQYRRHACEAAAQILPLAPHRAVPGAVQHALIRTQSEKVDVVMRGRKHYWSAGQIATQVLPAWRPACTKRSRWIISFVIDGVVQAETEDLEPVRSQRNTSRWAGVNTSWELPRFARTRVLGPSS
jgi:hypothetical protein